ncbi:hypothetical protein ACFSGI_17915 [Paenibacillus nicotianae]|uniref:Uncharacterized protein n=1 Tax=Paenibacillus nicotianae TaxID=1526551 RepID=A0ABW4V085_9BACL
MMILWFKWLWGAVALFHVASVVFMFIQVSHYFAHGFPLTGILLALIIASPGILLLGTTVGGLFLKKEGAKGTSGYIIGSLVMVAMLFLSKAYFGWS